MPIGIVYPLEVIKIDDQHTRTGIPARTTLQLRFQKVHDGGAIPDAGEVIMRGLDIQPVVQFKYSFRNAQPRSKLAFIKRFGEEIVGTGIHALEIAAPAVEGSQQNDISVLQGR